jgi:hypothetical protein
METMGDLLEKVKEFAFHNFSREEAERIFGWGIIELVKGTSEKDVSAIIITFNNGLVLYAWYFLNMDPTETGDTCEFRLGLRTDLISRIKYNVFYSLYIHGQGYIRLSVAETDNRMIKNMIDEFYVPSLKMIYKPIITQFQGFYTKDYFGVEADNARGEIYYSSVRSRSENKDLEISKVIGRLHELDSLLREPEIRHNLAEIDLQLSLIPGMLGSSL